MLLSEQWLTLIIVLCPDLLQNIVQCSAPRNRQSLHEAQLFDHQVDCFPDSCGSRDEYFPLKAVVYFGHAEEVAGKREERMEGYEPQ